MRIDLIPVGKSPPDDLNVIIEVPTGGEPVKYEFDKASGALFVDRFMSTAMHYPCNYGYIPNTLSDDGDPVDVLVVTPVPLISGIVVTCRPVGLLKMEDEAGGDEKLLTVPVDTTFPYYENVTEADHLPEIVLRQIEHFFTHYKDLEPEKWVRVGHWKGRDEALQIVRDSIAMAKRAADEEAGEGRTISPA